MMKLDELTEAQKKEIAEQYAEQQRIEKKAIIDKRNEYKTLVDETVREAFPKLTKVAHGLHEAKKCVYEDFAVLIDLKHEIYGQSDKDERKSFTFTDKTQQFKVILGYNELPYYDDTVSVGLQKVNSYIDSLIKDDQTRKLASTLRKLISTDAEGNLKPSRVMELEQEALDSGDADFVDGVAIIMAAFKPIKSKQFVRAQYKGEKNEWKNVPLGMTEA